ncbi:hypothetical protein Hanom_Chr00s084352g01795871 [Helianthus anomalus]
MGYGAGLWRGLGTNAQLTTSGGLGFRRGPLGGGFSSLNSDFIIYLINSDLHSELLFI